MVNVSALFIAKQAGSDVSQAPNINESRVSDSGDDVVRNVETRSIGVLTHPFQVIEVVVGRLLRAIRSIQQLSVSHSFLQSSA